MAVGDLYQLIDRQVYQNQQVRNVYYYRHDSGLGDWEDLATEFETDVLPSILTIQDPLLTHNRLDVINMDDPTDFGEYGLTDVVGTAVFSGDPAPSFICSSFRYDRASRDIRSGWKRYAGCSEGMYSGQNFTASFVTAANVVAAVLDNPIIDAQGNTWTPVLYGDVAKDRPTPIVRDISGVTFVNRVTTQNTRKVGHGN